MAATVVIRQSERGLVDSGKERKRAGEFQVSQIPGNFVSFRDWFYQEHYISILILVQFHQVVSESFILGAFHGLDEDGSSS